MVQKKTLAKRSNTVRERVPRHSSCVLHDARAREAVAFRVSLLVFFDMKTSSANVFSLREKRLPGHRGNAAETM
jgi:hypothetical protein